MSQAIHLPTFGGGIVVAGSPDSGQSDELERCDDLDIGPRGQLTPAGTVSTYTQVNDKNGVPAPIEQMQGVFSTEWTDGMNALAVGWGSDGGVNTRRWWLARFSPSSVASPVPAADVYGFGTSAVPALNSEREIATLVPFPYVKGGTQLRPIFVVAGNRGTPRNGAGLHVFYWDGAAYQFANISQFDAMGTGPQAADVVGTNGIELFFAGIEAYNNHLFGWGFDKAETTTGGGPNRLMFSNIGNPFKWGNDNLAAAGTDRTYSDTDAILIGGAGEIITCCLSHDKKLWIGTNKGLHYLAGYGRESFLTDGTHGIRKSLDVIGPHAMCEGPDGALYGCSKKGLWAYGNGMEHLYRKCTDFSGKSNGYWDLIWTDITRASGTPGQTNADFVWLMSYPELRQVWVVVPWCDATTGYGPGSDTVILKYHTDTGGFTRQKLLGQIWIHGARIPQGRRTPERTILVSGSGTANNVQHYAKRLTADVSPTPTGTTTLFRTRPHAQFGPNGIGVYRKAYLTLAWEIAGSLPLQFSVKVYVDDDLIDTVTVRIATTAANGAADYWLDTSGTDANIGTGTAGVLIGAAADYVFKRWDGAAWKHVPAGGQKGLRATLPIAFKPRRGARIAFEVARVYAAGDADPGGRYQIEGLGSRPVPISEAA